MSQSRVIYLVAGASRGIGLALVEEIAARDASAIIYAGARDPSAPLLKEVTEKYHGRVVVVKYVAGDKEGNDAIAKEIGAKYGRVDTVIANAGIFNCLSKVHETPILKFVEHFDVNAIGPIVLFQSIRELLKASPSPRFVPISSGAGSIERIPISALEVAPYGTSKAALNWITRKIHFENEWLVAFPQCPGPVDTDMAKQAKALDNAEVVELIKKLKLRSSGEVAKILIDIITASTREKDGGQFHNIDGGRHPW
ncbi:NAD(P)-binding protein [Pholiota conissans]|uniref:NAD(P)-binding protein n=1 Tax=Pholiota conissans TaxID=109636 RepID=A0A9P5YZD8_9AGAR|nr:NAD(P)-binding protein [Pholiota conissans]